MFFPAPLRCGLNRVPGPAYKTRAVVIDQKFEALLETGDFGKNPEIRAEIFYPLTAKLPRLPILMSAKMSDVRVKMSAKNRIFEKSILRVKAYNVLLKGF